MSTCNWLDLSILGFQPVMPKISLNTASNGLCFMVIWIVFKNHLLKVGVTQNHETMALRTLTTVAFLSFIKVWGPAWIETHWSSIWLRARSHMASHCTWVSVTILRGFWRCGWDGLSTLSIGLPQFHGQNSWIVCELALIVNLTWFVMPCENISA